MAEKVQSCRSALKVGEMTRTLCCKIERLFLHCKDSNLNDLQHSQKLVSLV